MVINIHNHSLVNLLINIANITNFQLFDNIKNIKTWDVRSKTNCFRIWYAVLACIRYALWRRIICMYPTPLNLPKGFTVRKYARKKSFLHINCTMKHNACYRYAQIWYRQLYQVNILNYFKINLITWENCKVCHIKGLVHLKMKISW